MMLLPAHPSERSTPISLVRSKTDMAMVLAMPSAPTSSAMSDVPQAAAWASTTSWLLDAALGGGYGAQTGQCGFDGGLAAVHVFLGREARGGAQLDVEGGDLTVEARKLLQLTERHDDGAGLERGATLVNACDLEGSALNFERVTGRFAQAVGEQLAEHDLLGAVVEALALDELERCELERVGAQAVDNRIVFRRDVHHVDDHGRDGLDLGQLEQDGACGLVDRGIHEGFLHNRDVGAGGLVEVHPGFFVGAREAHQRDKGGDAHGDAGECERGSETSSPDVFEREARQG